MDNTKTGLLIRQKRTELGMTQRELAEKLNITDKAVSKWERGLSAPDIALLEPLGAILGLTVTELISGCPGQGEDVAKVIEYSVEAMGQKTRHLQKRHLSLALGLLLILALALGIWLKSSHALHIIERVPSPEGDMSVTVYDCDISGENRRPSVSIVERRDPAGRVRSNFIYAGSYGGLWWSPDGTKYVLSLMTETEGEMLMLNDLTLNNCRNLDAYLSMGVEYTELKQYGFVSQGIWPEIDYEFLQWSRDSSAVLIYYSFTDGGGAEHSGYFWYDHAAGKISGIMELMESNQSKKLPAAG